MRTGGQPVSELMVVSGGSPPVRDPVAGCFGHSTLTRDELGALILATNIRPESLGEGDELIFADPCTVPGQGLLMDTIRQRGPLAEFHYFMGQASRWEAGQARVPTIEEDLALLETGTRGLLLLVGAVLAGMKRAGVGRIVVHLPVTAPDNPVPAVAEGVKGFVTRWVQSVRETDLQDMPDIAIDVIN